jgi:N-formylglutamate deformylase
MFAQGGSSAGTSFPLWQIEFGDAPLVACAIHDGHVLRSRVAEIMGLDAAQRLYEEDPHTAKWTVIAPTRVVARQSRFEVDLNRPREQALYLKREDAWGLDVWKSPPPPALVSELQRYYDDFYAHLRVLLERLVERHRRVVVFDLHSYNHVRDGAGRPFAAPEQNPEINLGTRSMERDYWAPVVDRFLQEMRSYDFVGRRLDVRENVKFFGGHMVTWLHDRFPRQVCGLAIEVKKFFMDEWTGEADEQQLAAIGDALRQAAGGVLDELENWDDGRRDA